MFVLNTASMIGRQAALCVVSLTALTAGVLLANTRHARNPASSADTNGGLTIHTTETRWTELLEDDVPTRFTRVNDGGPWHLDERFI